jgi:transposase
MLRCMMSRHTTFRFCLDPTVEQCEVLARHAGAARFAFNQCLGMVKTSLTARKANPDTEVPWTGFDLINTFNAWKKTEDAGRVFTVDTDGVAEPVVTGLAWRAEVCQQVFEEAAVDLGKALRAWSDSRSGKRRGPRVGFPRFKKKTATALSFRLRSKHRQGRLPAIRVGDNDRPRSVTLPGIGAIAVHDDTRGLRRMLAQGRAKILFATISHHAGRWWVSLNVEPPTCTQPTTIRRAVGPTMTVAGSVSIGGCRRSWSRPPPTVKRLPASPTRPKHSPTAWCVSAAWRNRCPASRKDQPTAARPQPSWDVTTNMSRMRASISCTRCPMHWSRPTTGSSSKT